MSGVLGTIFGTKPKVSNNPYNTIDPTQQNVLSQLATLLQTGATPPGVQAYTGQFAAPLQPLQLTSLSGLENIANNTSGNTTPQQGQVASTANTALLNLLQGNGPKIDASSVIQNSVVDPLTKAFNDTILPGIIGKYAGSAGGTFSSDAMNARRLAGQDLESQIASEAGNLGFNAANANQNSTLSGILSGLSQAGNIGTLPTQFQGANTNLLTSLLNAGSVPYNVAQTQTSGQYQDFLNQLNQRQSLLADMISTFAPQTTNTNTVVTPGSPGLLGSLLSSGGGGGLGGLGALGALAIL